MIDGKIRCASVTAAAAIETDVLPMSVRVRTSCATSSVRVNRRSRMRPNDPAASAVRIACFTWPMICGSPSTIDPRPLATRKACGTARSRGNV